MARPQMTREELARMIMEQLPHLRLQHVEVYPDKKLGWTAQAVVPPRLLADMQPIIDDTVAQLREAYDLKAPVRERILFSLPGVRWIGGLIARLRHRGS